MPKRSSLGGSLASRWSLVRLGALLAGTGPPMRAKSTASGVERTADARTRVNDRMVVDEYLASPGATWIARVWRLSPTAFARVSGRIRRGLKFGVAARVEDDRHRILLVQMAPKAAWTSKWTVPGGGAEPGETPRQAIVREVAEETGVRLRDLRLWRVYHETLRSPTGERVEWDFLQYTARWASGMPRSRVPEEIAEVRWFPRLPVDTEFRDDWLRLVRG